MNSATHSSSKYSPNFVNFGQDIVTSGKDYKLIVRDEEHGIDENAERLKKIREMVQGNLKKSHEQSKTRYDLRSRALSYKKGDIVWRKNMKLSDAAKKYSAKLAPKYIKCIVKQKHGTSNYELTDINGNDLGIFSSKLLKSGATPPEVILKDVIQCFLLQLQPRTDL